MKNKKIRILFVVIAVMFFTFIICLSKDNDKPVIVNENDYLLSLPENIRKLYEDNPETEDFVFSYNELYGTKSEVDLSEYIASEKMPLFMQWDKRWGYMQYSGDCVAITGCGPVCLSMAVFHLTKDENMSPDKIVEFAAEKGYYQNGYGSLWTLVSEGGEELGLNVQELPLDKNIIIRNLEQGNPVICVMGKGDFTSTGHFVVMREYKDGKIWINDPNSYENSVKGWEYEKIKEQIKNLWACSV